MLIFAYAGKKKKKKKKPMQDISERFLWALHPRMPCKMEGTEIQKTLAHFSFSLYYNNHLTQESIKYSMGYKKNTTCFYKQSFIRT